MNEPIVEMPYMVPETLPALPESFIDSRIANGEIIPNSVTGTSKQNQHAGKCPGQNANLQIVKGVCSQPQYRVGNIGHNAERKCPPSQEGIHGLWLRRPVSPAPADEITSGQVNQDQADDHRPNRVTGPENVTKQTGCAKLRRHAGHAGGEDGKVDIFAHG